MQPHRGTLILVLGILGIALCPILGPFAWYMGNTDLQEIRAGRMDPTGEGLTTAGKICGIIGTISLILSCICLGIYAVIIIVAAASGGLK